MMLTRGGHFGSGEGRMSAESWFWLDPELHLPLVSPELLFRRKPHGGFLFSFPPSDASFFEKSFL